MKETYYDHTSEPEKEIECEACQIQLPELNKEESEVYVPAKDATPLKIAKVLNKKEAITKETAWLEMRNSNFIFVVPVQSIHDWYWNHGYYGRRWRLWDEEPSEMQREVTGWDLDH